MTNLSEDDVPGPDDQFDPVNEMGKLHGFNSLEYFGLGGLF
jgi:hypothetical protein